jgi:surface antigen
MLRTLSVVASATLVLLGCVEQAGPKTVGGTALGAAAGGLIGSQFGSGTGAAAMTGLGVLLGAVLGSEVGRSLDRADHLTMERTTQQTLEMAPSGQSASWRNPDSGNAGTVTPIRTVQRSDGSFCREYQQSVTVGGRTEQAYGIACRQPDGSWRITQ